MAMPPLDSAKRVDAYLSLGVSPNDVLLAPKVTPLLKRICKEGTEKKGIEAAITYLRASSETAARQFIARYDDPSVSMWMRRHLPLEAFCLSAHLDPTDILGPITRVAHLHGAMIGAITAAERHPEVVAASLDAAVLPDGVQDRMANLKHMGYLPSPKGSSVNVNVNASATAQAASKSDGLESSESTIRRIVEARQKAALPTQQPQLPAAQVERVPAAFQPREREMVTIDADGGEDEE
jgi:hypothetical protein